MYVCGSCVYKIVFVFHSYVFVRSCVCVMHSCSSENNIHGCICSVSCVKLDIDDMYVSFIEITFNL